MEPTIPPRYQGKPLLVILENYVLAAIDELSPEKIRSMSEVIQAAWGGDADWMLTIRTKLDLPETTETTLREIWTRNKGAIGAEDFARQVVDENYRELFEGKPS